MDVFTCLIFFVLLQCKLIATRGCLTDHSLSLQINLISSYLSESLFLRILVYHSRLILWATSLWLCCTLVTTLHLFTFQFGFSYSKCQWNMIFWYIYSEYSDIFYFSLQLTTILKSINHSYCGAQESSWDYFVIVTIS